MAKDDIMDKIMKLKELASNYGASKAEATAAARAAQRLIAKYGINENDLVAQSLEVIEVSSTNVNRNAWAAKLALVIAENFRCRVYRSRECGCYGESTSMVFVGITDDALAADQTFQKLYEVGNTLVSDEIRRAKAAYGTSRGVKNAFLDGYVNGIRRELERQCHELMLVRPREVDEHYARLDLGTYRCKTECATGERGRRARDAGYDAGRDSVRRNRMNGQKALS